MALLGAQFVNAVSPNPVGSLQAYAGASAPTGWLLCDGTSYSTSVYPELFSVLGYTYGGSGANFSVPDLRGRMPMGAGTGAGLNASGTGAPSGTAMTTRTRGQWGGEETHAITGAETPAHTHAAGGLAAGVGAVNANTGWVGIAQVALPAGAPGSSSYTTAGSSGIGSYGFSNYAGVYGNTGGLTASANGSGHNTVPPFLVTNYIIKAYPDVPRSGIALGNTPPIVTALPTNPQFGEVVTYAADATNGIYWNLQYDASGTYPWKFIGGSPLTAQVDTDENIVAGTITYTALATAGPSITLALAGDYVISQGLRGYPFAVNQSLHMSYDIGATSASDNDSVLLDCASGFGENGSRTRLKTGIAANTAIVSKYKHTSTGAGANFAYRWMTITPVRVKAA